MTDEEMPLKYNDKPKLDYPMPWEGENESEV